MTLQVLGVYREAEYSPGSVRDDAAIIDAALAELERHGADTTAVDPAQFVSGDPPQAHLVLAMCQGGEALSRLAEVEESGALTVNSALAIRNCYRDLLGAGLMQAGVPTPEGALVATSAPLDTRALRSLDLSLPMYVKRGDMHALGSDDVQRVDGLDHLEASLLQFARRKIASAYVQQAVPGDVVKFYGVSGSEYFSAEKREGEVTDSLKRALSHAAAEAASALGLEVWGGDAVVDGGQFWIIDFNDWPSYRTVRAEAARAIARRCMLLLRRNPAVRDLRL